MKIINKAQLIKYKKVAYANVEKNALVQLSSDGGHPGIIKLYFTTQDPASLCKLLVLNGNYAYYSL